MYTDIIDNLGGLFSGIASAINSLGSYFSSSLNNIGQYFSSGLNSMGNALNSGFSSLISKVNGLVDLLGLIKNNLVILLDYINPFSDNFFLKIAFVPRDGYFEQAYNRIDDSSANKFIIVDQMFDSWNAVKNSSYSSSQWQGIKINMSRYGCGELTIVSPVFINYMANKIKYWISGVIYLFMLLFTFKRIAGVLDQGGEI